MTDYTPPSDKGTVRPTYVPLGTDDLGRHHVYRTSDETVHVVDPEAGRTLREPIADRPVDEWMAFVDVRRGWDRRQYGVSLVDMLTHSFRVEA